jgi:microsomal dipeptidase-like Zn-dependent dipeptidase
VVVDLHAHYPMQLIPDGQGATLGAMTKRAGRARRRDRMRALLLRLASWFGNWRSPTAGPRVTIEGMRAGGVGVALSVLYSPFDEMDIGPAYGAPPQPGYFERLLRQIDLVEERLDGARLARTPAEMDAALDAGELALVHCVEGAFHLPADPGEAAVAVRELAARGVAYLTIAHLFWRRIATNTNAIPFLPDGVYDFLFPQPKSGLTDLGEAIVRACAREGVIIDLSHCSAQSAADILTILDEIDPAEEVPVIVTHAGYRFGKQQYMVDDALAKRIAARGGVIGLICAQHQLNDGLRRTRGRRIEHSADVLCRHVERLAQVTGSFDHIAVGSDFDGFIKPTLAGLEESSDLAKLDGILRPKFGDDATDAILSGNAMRVLRAGWGRKRE